MNTCYAVVYAGLPARSKHVRLQAKAVKVLQQLLWLTKEQQASISCLGKGTADSDIVSRVHLRCVICWAPQ